MKKSVNGSIMMVVVALAICVPVLEVHAQEAAQTAPYTGVIEPPVYLRADGYDYDHEIHVALPASYHTSPEKEYPVLWITDGVLYLGMAANISNYYAFDQLLPEIIVVSVGHRREVGVSGFMAMRTIDFFPPGTAMSIEGPSAAYMRSIGDDPETLFEGVQGNKFLDFLIDKVRPELAKKYRMADDHALLGHSAGGAFTGYALFARPGAFSRYIIGSGTNPLSLELEEEYAKTHDDMKATVFFGMGDLEPNKPLWSALRLVSRTVQLAENLILRQYPSLKVSVRLYRDKNHTTVLPLILGDGLEAVYADLVPKPNEAGHRPEASGN